MVNVSLLGTGGSMLVPIRPLTSLLIKHTTSVFLVDCGESSQLHFRSKELPGICSITAVFLTHGHLDHWGGLIGLLSTMECGGRKDELILVYPSHMTDKIKSIKQLSVYHFPIIDIVLERPEEDIKIDDIFIKAFLVEHSVPTYGYSFYIPRQGKIDQTRVDSSGIPIEYWALLQNNYVLKKANFNYDSTSVYGDRRRGIKITYCTDSRPCTNLYKHAKDSDLLVCEGMYATSEDLGKALSNKHMTMQEAAEVAKSSKVNELWLTHYSPSLLNPTSYTNSIKDIFENTIIPFKSYNSTIGFINEKETRDV